MGKKYFDGLRDKYKKSDERMAALDMAIESNEAKKELKILDEELKSISKEIENIKNKIINLNNEFEKINVSQLKKNLQKEIKEVINEEIAIP